MDEFEWFRKEKKIQVSLLQCKFGQKEDIMTFGKQENM
jgi:hypothetical protein